MYRAECFGKTWCHVPWTARLGMARTDLVLLVFRLFIHD